MERATCNFAAAGLNLARIIPKYARRSTPPQVSPARFADTAWTAAYCLLVTISPTVDADLVLISLPIGYKMGRRRLQDGAQRLPRNKFYSSNARRCTPAQTQLSRRGEVGKMCIRRGGEV